MSNLQKLRQAAAETTRIANAILADPETTEAEFAEAFRARDVAHVESLGMSAEQLGEARWETMCGCNGNDSPFHSYFGLESASDY